MAGICPGATRPALDRRAGTGICVECSTRQALTTAAREPHTYPVMHAPNVPSE